MMLRLFFLGAILLIEISLFGQRIEHTLNAGDIQFSVGKSTNPNNGIPNCKYVFDKEGNISHINSVLLNPVMSEIAYSYTADYQYSASSRLDKETVHRIKDGESELFRATNYEYQKDKFFVTVVNGAGEIIGEMVEARMDSNHVRRTYISDHVLGFPRNIDMTLDRHYDGEVLVKLKMENSHASWKNELSIRRAGRTLEFAWQNQSDTIYNSGKSHRFYDRKGRLRKIGTENSRRKWIYKISYGNAGLISKITGRGRMYGTGKMIYTHFLFDVRVPKGLKDEVVKKINDEFINMYHPISIGNSVYCDSRRFIISHG